MPPALTKCGHARSNEAWLEVMAHAAGAPAKRFLSVYQPGGTVLDKFWPSATDPTTSTAYGDPKFNSGALTGLTG